VSQAWRDVDRGVRELDWAVAIGDPDELDFLSGYGGDVARRMAADLDAFFSAGWLTRARRAAAEPALSAYWPSLRGRPAFMNAVGLWASLQLLLEDPAVAVAGTLRRMLRDNPSRDEFLHHVTLARLAAQARLMGARVEIEPVAAPATCA